jgi:hypothetical protein
MNQSQNTPAAPDNAAPHTAAVSIDAKSLETSDGLGRGPAVPAVGGGTPGAVVVLTTVLVTTTEVEGTPTVVVVGRLNAGAGGGSRRVGCGRLVGRAQDAA